MFSMFFVFMDSFDNGKFCSLSGGNEEDSSKITSLNSVGAQSQPKLTKKVQVALNVKQKQRARPRLTLTS